ncbi:MAG: rhamnose ABC transporter substrate-binding protein [Candidatus Hydrogenedentota bacterium]
MKRIFSALFLCAALVSGCGGQTDQAAPAAGGGEAAPAGEPGKKLKIGVMPKLTSIAFFQATEKGARQAADELGIELVYDGPMEASVEQQVQLLTTWMTEGFDAIAVAPNDPDAITPVLQKAKARGIKVITWDADAQPDARDFFVNQCTSASVAKSVLDLVAEGAGPNAKYIQVTGTLTATNQNIWMQEIEKYRQQAHATMTNLTPTPIAPGEDTAKATQMTIDALTAYPDANAIIALTSVALPGAAEALRKTGKASSITLIGLSTPNTMKQYIADGTVKKFVLWNAVDLGYLATQAAVACAKGELTQDMATFSAGHIGECKIIENHEIILGDPIIFDESNVNNFDF